MLRFLVLVFIFSIFCDAQTPQPQQDMTPQEKITSIVSRQAQVSSDVIIVLNQIPALIKQIQELQSKVNDLQEKLNKKEAKK